MDHVKVPASDYRCFNCGEPCSVSMPYRPEGQQAPCVAILFVCSICHKIALDGRLRLDIRPRME